MSRAVLITGASGQLGTALTKAAWPAALVPVPLDRKALDLMDAPAIMACVRAGHEGAPWAAVVNAGAYTAVDRAEHDVLAAWQVNALAPAAFAEACAALHIPLIQVSTDYVFPGDRSGAWDIGDPTGPLGVYGASKLGGEWAVRSACVRHAIVRTAWVVSPYGANFIRTMLRLARERDVVRVVADQYGSPTSANDLAAALILIATRLAADDAAPGGTFHFSNAGTTNWAAFATEIFSQSRRRGGPFATVEPISTSDYPTAARRPGNSVLSHAAIIEHYNIRPRDWQDAVSDILDELIGMAR